MPHAREFRVFIEPADPVHQFIHAANVATPTVTLKQLSAATLACSGLLSRLGEALIVVVRQGSVSRVHDRLQVSARGTSRRRKVGVGIDLPQHQLDRQTPTEELIVELVATGELPDPQQFDIATVCD